MPHSPDNSLMLNVRIGHGRGWSFTPLAGKRPILKAWQNAPRETLDQALAWAAQGNVGLRTGRISGVVVIDVDEGGSVESLALPSTITASTSGLNVIDIAAKKIIKTVPGRPHNYAISLDGKYLASTESTATDCNITPNDPGALVQFIDISTLLAGTPDPAKIVSLYQFIDPGFGGSHAAWDQTTGLFYYSVSDSTGQGWLYTLNTAKLSAATPTVDIVVNKAKIGWAPHGISYAGINGD